jgi:pimeloyl-ACP methyl ester carboxylesterase
MNYKIEGSGETLVFIHGLSDNLLYWEILANSLKDDFQILRFDLRGHGDSELRNDDITLDTYVNDLFNLLGELKIDKVNLIAFSLGGAIALDFVIKHPQLVSSLVIMSSFAKTEEYLKNILNDFKIALKNSFEEFYDLILPKVLCPQVIEENISELELIKEVSAQNANVEGIIKSVDVCMDIDIEDNLYEIDVPTLILAGKYDGMSLLSFQESMHDKIKNSQMVVFDNVKHNLLVGKNNIEILKILKNFLKK